MPGADRRHRLASSDLAANFAARFGKAGWWVDLSARPATDLESLACRSAAHSVLDQAHRLGKAWASNAARSPVRPLAAPWCRDLRLVRPHHRARQLRSVRCQSRALFPARQRALLARALCDLLVPAAERRRPVVRALSWPESSRCPLASARRKEPAIAASALHKRQT